MNRTIYRILNTPHEEKCAGSATLSAARATVLVVGESKLYYSASGDECSVSRTATHGIFRC